VTTALDIVELADAAASRRPRERALLWLSCLVPFFFVSYGFANWLAARRAGVGTIVFQWEAHIPFLDWTIVPYWSIDLFYVLSFFLCTTSTELDTHGKRLLTAQIVAVACFIAMPLRLSVSPPRISGPTGLFFQALSAFDRPYNELPSLHIALLVILWNFYLQHIPARFGPWLHAWFALVAVSVLTTYQHHFIDVPTGAALGWFCIWLWPAGEPSPFSGPAFARGRVQRRIAAVYGMASAAIAIVALALGGAALWLLWPSLSFTIVATNYALCGARGFQKSTDGRMSSPARWLLLPYLLGAWVNSRLWTWRSGSPVHVRDGVWLGRFPSRREARKFSSVVDLTAELPAPRHHDGTWHTVPVLDLVAPSTEALGRAATVIEAQSRRGNVLVVCALGRRRSPAAIATWLLATNRALDVAAAIALTRPASNRFTVADEDRAAIEGAVAKFKVQRP
jgi:protein-tyrosine phosphatase